MKKKLLVLLITAASTMMSNMASAIAIDPLGEGTILCILEGVACHAPFKLSVSAKLSY